MYSASKEQYLNDTRITVEKRLNELAAQTVRESDDCEMLSIIGYCNIFDSKIRSGARQKIADIKVPKDASQQQLMEIAIADSAVRMTALARLTDEQLKCKAVVALSTLGNEIPKSLLHGITDQGLLKSIVEDESVDIVIRIEAARILGINDLFGHRTLICPKCGQGVYRYTAFESIDSYKAVEGYECPNCDISCYYTEGFSTFTIGVDREMDLSGDLVLVCMGCGHTHELLTDSNWISPYECGCSSNSIIAVKYIDERR